ncbi:TAT-variant-translocated molybdopterin oxidoreductase [Planctomicrobium sp. SH664]|uniref:TAT-variant-translocated molybdopterin oxidoreductase n=1 Tax=Planctomicrobium sp. SH664 TaxID=3448125 RepID=UPI003F5C1541
MVSDNGQQPETPRSEPRFWRSLADWEGDPQFLSRVRQEFAPGAEWWIDQPSRRAFLKRMSASFALAGLTGCVRQPKEEIVPYVQTPEDFVPGQTLFFASAMAQPGGAIGILAQSHEGRPTKIEGNALHPASLGSTDTYAQAHVLNLYDPHRSRVVRTGDRLSNWPDFTASLQPHLDEQRAQGGSGLHVLTQGIISPTLQSQLRAFLDLYPQARWYQYDPSLSTEAPRGVELAFNTKATPHYKLADADIIFSLDADFLGEGVSRVRLAREFAARRRYLKGDAAKMTRLYVAETTPSITGASADHWLRLTPGQLSGAIVALAKEIGLNVEAISVAAADQPSEATSHWIKVLAEDLKAARGRSVIIPGPALPAAVQALVHTLNSELGNVGQSVTFHEPIDAVPNAKPGTIVELAKAIDDGQVETLLVLGFDAVYTAPAELNLAEKILKVPFTVHYGHYVDETAAVCEWHLPATHELEEWSDVRGEDGTVTIIQPLIAPLYDGRSLHELLNLLVGNVDSSGRDTVEKYWREQFGADAEAKWKKSLQDGVIADTASKPVNVTLAGNAAEVIARNWIKETSSGELFTLVFRNDVNLLDGRFSTNFWLQELPRPISKLTWGNTAWISPASAAKLNLKNGSHIAIKRADITVELPVWIQPGQPDGVLTLSTGHGRQIAEADVVGVNVNPLRTVANWWQSFAEVESTGRKTVLATTQDHHLMEGRDLVRVGSLQQLQADPEHPEFMHVGHGHFPPKDKEGNYPTLYPDRPEIGPQWGMSINLGACTGCNACVVACQSENNIPVVGADQIRRGREMQWLRIDSYFAGEPESPEIYHQPVTCMHCEHAPCEPVCPVGATTHSDSGLNEMTYNRCIGTRYCSNNCPYKVRRFNFLDFRTETKEEPVLQLLQNPNVTVRSRGVMEKCTYCVQRINSVRINAKIEDREIRDGEVVTACQAACPSQAIVFGNVADKTSEVAARKADPLNYGLLEELNTRPRTTYLAAVKNPNPKLVPVATAKEHG